MFFVDFYDVVNVRVVSLSFEFLEVPSHECNVDTFYVLLLFGLLHSCV